MITGLSVDPSSAAEHTERRTRLARHTTRDQHRISAMEERFGVQEERMSAMLALIVRVPERLDGTPRAPIRLKQCRWNGPIHYRAISPQWPGRGGESAGLGHCVDGSPDAHMPATGRRRADRRGRPPRSGSSRRRRAVRGCRRSAIDRNRRCHRGRFEDSAPQAVRDGLAAHAACH